MDELLKLLQVPKHVIDGEINHLESRIWVPDEGFGYRLCTVVDDRGRDVVVGFRDLQGNYQKKLVPKCQTHRTSLSHYCEDMCSLSELNEACALHTIRSRYEQKLIHTYSGLFCVVINPWSRVPLYTKDMAALYMNAKINSANMPPHVYAVAQNAYEGIQQRGGKDQAILITGESGAGKTENTKKIIEYLILAAEAKRIRSNEVMADVQAAIVSAGVALESFSNARTIHNHNSSRLGKFIRIEFDYHGQLTSAIIDCYLLEKSRVVSQNEGDRNFHVFYELLVNDRWRSLRLKLGLTQPASHYRFLNQGGTSLSGMNDNDAARETEQALAELGFDEKAQELVYELIIGIILLGEMKFDERQGMDVSYPVGMAEAERAANVLRVKASKLVDAVTQPSIKVGDRVIRKSQNLKKTLLSVAALAKIIYQRLFEYILARCNDVIQKRSTVSGNSVGGKKFIGVLDMAGFEIMRTNSFEQLCINFTNEKLQQFFNHFMFVKEQAEYLSEGIEWDQWDYGNDLEPTIAMIEKPMGLLSLLQEECIIPNSSDETLLAKLIKNLEEEATFNKIKMSSRNKCTNGFLITHYTGQVAYSIDGWLEKNRDLVDQSVLEVLSGSEHVLLGQLFPRSDPSSDPNRKPSRRGSLASSTVSFIYKEQLNSLLNTLNSTQAHFIRCIVPNTSRRPFELDAPLVLHQLKCNGVLEGLRICQRGFPCRISFQEFIDRYVMLCPRIDRSVPAVKQVVQMVEELNLDLEKFQIGRSKLFCKTGFLSEMEDRRKERISENIVLLQAHIRWYHEQERLAVKEEEHEAILTIQENVRQYVNMHSWTWFLLWKRTRQLIPMARDRKRLQELEVEVDSLKKLCNLLKQEKEDLIYKTSELEDQIDTLEEENEAFKNRRDEIADELKRNEDLLDVMEKKFDDQHAKIMKLNTTLKDNVAALERLETEKKGLDKQISQLKENLHAETTLRINAEGAYESMRHRNEELERQIDSFSTDMQKLQDQYTAESVNALEWQDKAERRQDINSELRHEIAELNDRINFAETALHQEKTRRREFEKDIDIMEEEVARLEEDLDKSNVQKDALKEQVRVKDNSIRKLERQLEDKKSEMHDCIEQLRSSHRNKMNDVHTQLDDYKRKCMKLEAENKQQKAKLESNLERENSLEPDLSRPGSALSRYGSRISMSSSMYSNNSASGVAPSSGIGSSIRTLGCRRRDTDSDIKLTSLGTSTYSYDSSLSKYTLQQSPSCHRLSRQNTLSNVHQTLADLDRSPSASSLHQQQQLQTSERKCTNLEREIQTLKTDCQLLKRELEVYKQSLQESELAEKALKDEEEKSQGLELQLRKTQNELEVAKRKLEEEIAESKNDIMAERRRFMDKMNKQQCEFEMKLQLFQSNQRASEATQKELLDLQAQLDRAQAEITQLNRIQKSTTTMGETWEQQYRNVLQEMEALRDENASLKSKIRRQYKQIELLTQQNEIDDCFSELEDKVGRVQDRFEG